jgi:hypothetical protein
MVRLERGGVVVSVESDRAGRRLIAVYMPRPQAGRRVLELAADDARWLASVALPSAVAALAKRADVRGGS